MNNGVVLHLKMNRASYVTAMSQSIKRSGYFNLLFPVNGSILKKKDILYVYESGGICVRAIQNDIHGYEYKQGLIFLPEEIDHKRIKFKKKRYENR